MKHSTTRPLSIEQLECRRLLAFNPTADEQQLMQLVNRFRTDPRGEFNRLIATVSPLKSRDPVLQVDLDYARVDGNVLRSEMSRLSPVPPVSWNEQIRDFTLAHNADMIRAKNHFHSDGSTRVQKLLDAGVDLRIAGGETILAENVYGYGKSTLHIFAAYVLDWQRGGPNGMVPGRSHRVAIMEPDFDQLGQGISNFGGSGFGPKVNTMLLGNINKTNATVTGAIFEDRNSSGWYEAGEGLSGVRYTFTGPAGTFTTTGHSTGGYAIDLPPGTYSATATGGGMKYTQRINGLVVGEENVWQNWIYDPDVIPPDAYEANNTPAQASQLNGKSQTIAGLNIHRSSDVDVFRMVAQGNGELRVDISFQQQSGDLDLQLLDGAGKVIASATSTSDDESLTVEALRGRTYYARVLGKSGAINGMYSLSVAPPTPAPPIANADRAILGGRSELTHAILANDVDPDGDASQLSPRLRGGDDGFSLTSDGRVRFQPTAVGGGVFCVQYDVTDDQGLTSSPTTLEVFVVDLAHATPWSHPTQATDVNDDGITTPLDALLVVNELNQRSSRKLPTAHTGTESIFGFVDASRDGFVTPLDALLVINRINGGEGEGESVRPDERRADEFLAEEIWLDEFQIEHAMVDQAIASLWMTDEEQRRRTAQSAAET